ncbi:MAG: class IV adenylate cyclase [Anaerolineae bacterium]|nr:class IV adenylate cyclase [Anaerolineae bacterium]
MNKLVETEVKLVVPDLKIIQTRLDTAGAILTTTRVYERNLRYENKELSLTPNDIVLRLRQDNQARLTYKAPFHTLANTEPPPPGVTTRFEAEVTVSDFDTMHVILQRLGYHPHMMYEKYRTTYTLGRAEVVLDEMPFGSFIEVEGSPAAIDATLTALGLQSEPRILVGYMVLFERVKHTLGLTFNDLSFANFEGIDVPPEAFRAVQG